MLLRDTGQAVWILIFNLLYIEYLSSTHTDSSNRQEHFINEIEKNKPHPFHHEESYKIEYPVIKKGFKFQRAIILIVINLSPWFLI